MASARKIADARRAFNQRGCGVSWQSGGGEFTVRRTWNCHQPTAISELLVAHRQKCSFISPAEMLAGARSLATQVAILNDKDIDKAVLTRLAGQLLGCFKGSARSSVARRRRRLKSHQRAGRW